MSNLKYLIHYTWKEEYESIMKDGYLKFNPENCTHSCDGIYTQAVFDNMPFMGYLAPYPIYINKSILLNRKDYIIRTRHGNVTKKYPKEKWGFYGGEIVYDRRKYKNAKSAERKLQKVFNNDK